MPGSIKYVVVFGNAFILWLSFAILAQGGKVGGRLCEPSRVGFLSVTLFLGP